LKEWGKEEKKNIDVLMLDSAAFPRVEKIFQESYYRAIKK